MLGTSILMLPGQDLDALNIDFDALSQDLDARNIDIDALGQDIDAPGQEFDVRNRRSSAVTCPVIVSSGNQPGIINSSF